MPISSMNSSLLTWLPNSVVKSTHFHARFPAWEQGPVLQCHTLSRTLACRRCTLFLASPVGWASWRTLCLALSQRHLKIRRLLSQNSISVRFSEEGLNSCRNSVPQVTRPTPNCLGLSEYPKGVLIGHHTERKSTWSTQKNGQWNG